MTESTKARTGGRPIPESQSPDRDYPQMVGERGLIEPAPRRVRGYFDGTLVFDTTRAHYVWEIAYYPQYYVPVGDVRTEHLQDENHVQKLQLGSSRLFSLTSPKQTHKSAARLYDSGPVAGSVRFEWDALEWFEEDEPRSSIFSSTTPAWPGLPPISISSGPSRSMQQRQPSARSAP